MEGQILTHNHAAHVAKEFFKSAGKDWDAEAGPMQDSITRHVFSVARCVVVDGAKPDDLTEVEQQYWKAWQGVPITLKSEVDQDSGENVLTYTVNDGGAVSEEGAPAKKTKGK